MLPSSTLKTTHYLIRRSSTMLNPITEHRPFGKPLRRFNSENASKSRILFYEILYQNAFLKYIKIFLYVRDL